VSPGEVAQLGDYIGLLTKWNKSINLTALSVDPLTDEAIDRLLVEPLVAARRIHPTDALLIDIGSGGGSPAVPLKIAAPWLRLVMVEVKVRKSAFLREVVRHLGLTDTVVENRRFEELLSSPDLFEAADIVSLRAVRADRKLWRGLQALLKPGGRLFWFGAGAAPQTDAIIPPLRIETTESLVPALGSHLTILSKSH
jgi:16S rRNA (guanine527-N7)-methyltransferase